jgi:2-polyprenyl-6-methoxyphenol hydroxylase-like FAD-dependent oxidoreductase
MGTQHRKALIIGCGAAGPTLALFLKRAGIASEIYEAHSEAASYSGWFLNLAGNGIGVLQALGIADAISAEGSPVPRMIMWSGAGKRLGEVRNGAREGLTESVVIRRGELQRILNSAVKAASIRIHFEQRLRSVESADGQGVVATFEDGSTARGDFLIGADGIHSRVRALLSPNAPTPSYTGLVSTGGFTTHLSLPATPKTQHFIFGKRAFFGYHVRSSGEIYWFNNHARVQAPSRTELTQIVSEDWKERLLEMHRGDMAPIEEIIRSTEEGIGAFPIFDLPPQPIWHQGRIALVGDAVHAISPSAGQGASLALEDAAVLAKSLRDASSLEEAFGTYERLRRARVERMVAWARSLGGAKLITNPIQVFFRDLMLPLFLKRSANPSALDWIYAYDVAWDAPIAAPTFAP